MTTNGDWDSPPVFQPTILDLDDRTHPPFFVWRGSDEESFRPVATEDILFLLKSKALGQTSRAAAIAELERRGVSPPDA
jgi:hypothetical protein